MGWFADPLPSDEFIRWVFEAYRTAFAEGWSASRQGYLGETQMAYVLAVDAALRGIPFGDFRGHLKSNPRSDCKAAVRDLDKRWPAELEALRSAS